MRIAASNLPNRGVNKPKSGRRGLSPEARRWLKGRRDSSASRPNSTPVAGSVEFPERVDWDQFVVQLGSAEEGGAGTWVPRWFREITQDGDDATLLAQLVYWFRRSKSGKPRAQVFRFGQFWVAKTAKQWESDLRIPARKVRRILHRLRVRGYIVTRESGFAGQKTMLHRLNGVKISGAVLEAMSNTE